MVMKNKSAEAAEIKAVKDKYEGLRREAVNG